MPQCKLDLYDANTHILGKSRCETNGFANRISSFLIIYVMVLNYFDFCCTASRFR